MPQILQPIALTAAVTLNRKTHAETPLLLSLAAGFVVTLPAAEGKGASFHLFAAITCTGSYVIKVGASPGTDVMQGGVSLSTDIGGTNMLTGATADTLTMNGSTSGGLIGSWVTLKDVKAGVWEVSGFLVTTGAEADPFSATVP